MNRSLTRFDLGLPDGWHPLPMTPPDGGWETTTAQGIVEGYAVSDLTIIALATQLKEVAASVTQTGVRGASVAVLVRTPATPLVEAMLTMVLGRGVSRPTYEAQLDEVAVGVPDASVMGRQPLDAHVPAGDVVGAHLLIGHLPVDLDEAGVHLEERVHLGVFPDRCADMIDLTVVAAGIGVFEDLPAVAVGLLDGLEVAMEGSA